MARPRSDIRERVLREALQVFLQRGVDGASLRQVARQAGTNIGMIYYYFPTKDDLFLGVVEETYVGILDRMRRALEPPAPFEARLLALFEFPSSLNDTERRVARLVLREALASHERMQALLERFKRGHLPLLFGLIQQGLAEGAIDPRRSPFVALACLAGIGVLPQVVLTQLAAQLPTLGAAPAVDAALPATLRDIYLRAFASEGAPQESS